MSPSACTDVPSGPSVTVPSDETLTTHDAFGVVVVSLIESGCAVSELVASIATSGASAIATVETSDSVQSPPDVTLTLSVMVASSP